MQSKPIHIFRLDSRYLNSESPENEAVFFRKLGSCSDLPRRDKSRRTVSSKTGRQKQVRWKPSILNWSRRSVNTDARNYYTWGETGGRYKHRLHYWLLTSLHHMVMTVKIMGLQWSPNKLLLIINQIRLTTSSVFIPFWESILLEQWFSWLHRVYWKS